ncbi:MAG: 3-dehydroquinate synthase, partial [Sphaerochaetaceae bacterium]|nr:3-dehydroquinate synthase [Sphaerochaetaceae bacterium]
MEKQIECLGTKVIFADGFSSLSGEIEKLDSPVLWVCDSNTARMVRPLPEPNVILQPGTASKHWPSVERILSVAVENSFPKNGTFLALGGGVITDVTGFAASIYHRG